MLQLMTPSSIFRVSSITSSNLPLTLLFSTSNCKDPYDCTGPMWVVQDKVSCYLNCNLTYSQVLGIRMQTSCGRGIIMPLTDVIMSYELTTETACEFTPLTFLLKWKPKQFKRSCCTIKFIIKTSHPLLFFSSSLRPPSTPRQPLSSILIVSSGICLH